jgi:site-specific DNA recombinase
MIQYTHTMKNNNSTIKYILYCRKSTDTEDKQAASIEDQLEEMRGLAERMGLTIVEEITESKSAKNPESRPGFALMLKKIEAGEANGILCWKINRLSRNPVDGGKINWLLQKSIIRHIQTYSKDYNPWDNVLMMSVEMGMSNQYSNDLSTDVRRSQRAKSARGWFAASQLPMGYKHIKEYKLGEAEIMPDPRTFDTVKVFWGLLLDGTHSVPDIERKAKNMGFVNPKGVPYSRVTFYNTFSNSFYAGIFLWNDEGGTKVERIGKHQLMVSEEEFNKVQMYLGTRGRPTRINKCDFALRSCISCGECGCAVTAERKLQAYCKTCSKKYSMRTSTVCPGCNTDISEMKKPSIVDKTYYRCTRKKGNCK